MAKLSDILKRGVPCEVSWKNIALYSWTGEMFSDYKGPTSWEFCIGDDWSLVVKETPESVAEKRGYKIQRNYCGDDRWYIEGKDKNNTVYATLHGSPSIARVNEIIDELEKTG